MTAHKHAALIAEWVKDTSRVVEFRFGKNDHWKKTATPAWDERAEYRFAPAKPEVTSPLSDDEIAAIWGMARGTAPEFGREIAIAAKIATIREIAAMPSETTLTDGELVELTLMGRSSLSEIRRDVANVAIAEFQQKLLAGIGE